MFGSFLLIAAVLAGPSARASTPLLPLKTAESGRFLVNQRGEPFLIVGDTAWSLIAQLGEEDIDRYLEDRSKRGFNSVIVNLIEHRFCAAPPKTRAGLAPFKKAGDFSTPNPDYFAFAHGVVKKANDRGIVVWLFPSYLGFGGGEEGFFSEMKDGGRARLRAYGRFVGERFKDLPNIVWVMGGDFTPGEADRWTVTEVAEGIREVDSATDDWPRLAVVFRCHCLWRPGVAHGQHRLQLREGTIPADVGGVSAAADPPVRPHRVHLRGRARLKAGADSPTSLLGHAQRGLRPVLREQPHLAFRWPGAVPGESNLAGGHGRTRVARHGPARARRSSGCPGIG